MKYDSLLEKVGSFGPFQKRLCFYLILSSIPNGYLVLSIVFVGITPPHRCYVNEIDGVNSSASLEVNKTSNETLQQYIPLDRDGNLDSCRIFVNSSDKNNSNKTSATTSCPNGWIYETERSTFVSEWDFVCSQSWIQPLVATLFMIGVLFGSLTSGLASDRFGRRPVFLFGTFAMFFFFGLCGLAISPTMYFAFIFLAGATNMVNYITAFVLASEIINTKNRVVAGTMTVGGFAIGYMLIAPVAYLISSWKWIYISTGITGILFVPYFWVIPESPRWLLCQGRMKEFQTVMKKIAKANQVSESEISALLDKDLLQGCNVERNEKKFSFSREFLNNRASILRTVNVCYCWFVNAVLYYGISFNTSELSGSPYWNCFIAGLVEIPAYILVILVMNKSGRKKLLQITLVLAALACGAVPLLKLANEATSTAMAMLGKLAVAASFNIIYIYTAELFPTSARNSAVGFGSMFARIGAGVSPYLLYLAKVSFYLPYVIMLLLGVVSVVFTCFLPETNHRPLPDSFQETNVDLEVSLTSGEETTSDLSTTKLTNQ